MVDLKDIKKLYFIGIGGIGMSALARYFHFHGKEVSGYDKTSTPLTRELTNEGIPVHYEEDPDNIPRDAGLIVYTPAVPKNHRELVWYQQHSYTLLKRSEVLGLITGHSFNICVAGTHGKTTITTLIAHILRHSGYGCNAFLGGIAVNYNSNFWSDPRNVCVVEADEYDRSFLRLSPDIAVITAMDADHLDIYGTATEMQQAFIDFSGRLKPGGLLFSKKGLPLPEATHRLTYGLSADPAPDAASGSLTAATPDPHTVADPRAIAPQAASSPDVLATGITIEEGSYRFTVQTREWTLEKILLPMGGRHNVENATVAIAIAHHLGIEDKKILAAVEAFQGVKRRFEYILNSPDRVFIDDYAHHPEELRALISGAKELYPDRKCTLIFQPHLFSRTRDFAADFADSLEGADEVFLLPIYPARELPVEGVTSALIADKMTKEKVTLCDKNELLDRLALALTAAASADSHDDAIVAGSRAKQVIITAGAGDIDALVQPIRQLLERFKNIVNGKK